jgi:predicted kinase
MTSSTTRLVSLTRVPVSITETVASNLETRVPALKITSVRQMRRLVGALVHGYGWTLGQDGNLYSPNPAETAWGERVN